MEKDAYEKLERARARDFYRYYPSITYERNHIPTSHGTLPESSSDPALTAFAQLGALRLNAKRALISLFNREQQHILAEATRTLSLQSDTEHELADELLLGCSIVPRVNSPCSFTLDLALTSENVKNTSSVLVINDVAQDDRFAERCYLTAGPSSLRFYAGAPIRSPDGINIGSYCVMDDKPRNGLDDRSRRFLQDMAKTVMEHLRMARAQNAQQRSEKMVRGIGHFIEGKLHIRERPGSTDEVSPQPITLPDAGRSQQDEAAQYIREMNKAGVSTESSEQGKRSARDHRSVNPRRFSTDLKFESKISPGPGFSDNRRDELVSRSNGPKPVISSSEGFFLDDGSNLSNITKIFSRASNIIREALELEGVIFFEVGVGSFGEIDPRGNPFGISSSSATPKSESRSARIASLGSVGQMDVEERRAKRCAILGFSTTSQSSSQDGQASESIPFLSEPFIRELVQKYPEGRVIRAEELRNLSSGTLEVSTADVESQVSTAQGRLHPNLARSPPFDSTEIETFLCAIPEARNIAFLPLWDFYRGRWFAGTLVWANNPTHVLNAEGELSYLAAFGNSVMAEVARLDAVTADRAKADFISSISHELRSPLHGILGNAEFLHDTPMNSIQERMVHNIDVCGKTLLDTINHVLDFAKINNSQKFTSLEDDQSQGRNPKSEALITKQARNALEGEVDVSAVIEEVTETVFAGHVYRNPAQGREQKVPKNEDSPSIYKHYGMYAPDLNEPGSESSKVKIGKDRDSLIVILDIDHNPTWNFLTEVGAWRRILMNCLGNSLKYTEGGYIKVELSCTDSPSNTEIRTVTLTLSDTGRGISKRFLKDFLFTPFTQEDPHMAGIGLGLSIMRQMVTSVGGTIDVRSETGVGTEVEVSVPLRAVPRLIESPNYSKESLQSKLLRTTKGLRVGLVGFDNLRGSPVVKKGTALLESALRRLCEDWFDMEVFPISDNTETDADLYIATKIGENNLMDEANNDKDALSALWRRVERHPVIIIWPDASVPPPSNASPMQGADGERIVHFIPQPCGPRKLAQALNACFKSQEKQKESSPPQGKEETANPRLHDSPQTPSKSSIRKDLSDLSIQMPVNPASARSPDQALKSSNIMLVEDNSVNLQLLQMYMKKMGYSYQTATNGLEALETYKSAKGAIDCVLMDISMPVMDGMQATREIRQHEREESLKAATIIALTGLASAEAQQEAHDSGFNLFLIKPVKFQTLTETLRQQGH